MKLYSYNNRINKNDLFKLLLKISLNALISYNGLKEIETQVNYPILIGKKISVYRKTLKFSYLVEY